MSSQTISRLVKYWFTCWASSGSRSVRVWYLGEEIPLRRILEFEILFFVYIFYLFSGSHCLSRWTSLIKFLGLILVQHTWHWAFWWRLWRWKARCKLCTIMMCWCIGAKNTIISKIDVHIVRDNSHILYLHWKTSMPTTSLRRRLLQSFLVELSCAYKTVRGNPERRDLDA